MNPARPPLEKRVLLLTLTARDAEATISVLGKIGVECIALKSIDELCHELHRGAAAIIIPEQALIAESADRLANSLHSQAVWSDLPVIVLSHSRQESAPLQQITRKIGIFTLLERPMRVATLISTIVTAMRARERQYQIREHLLQEALASERIREARDEAEAASRAKDRFLAVLSHELRTPLAPVVMTLAAMARDPEFPEAFRNDVEIMRRNVTLEARLIDDLLDISRVITGKLKLDLKPVSLHETMRHVLDTCASEINNKRVQVSIAFDAKKDGIEADPTRVQQIFWNLLKNAVKFSDEGGSISLRTWNDRDDRFVAQVSDDGVGIAAEHLERIFETFDQGEHAASHRFGGLGLGLAISRNLAEMHGGSLYAASQGAGRGSTFTVEFPHATVVSGETSRCAPGTARRPAPRLRLLLVEDNADTLFIMSRMLEQMGYRVRSATDIASALDLAGRETFDVLISDLGLPDGTGYDLMRQLRQESRLPGIALSGYGMEGDMRKSRESGFSDHLVKPVDFDRLQEVIERVAFDEQLPVG